MLIVAPVYANTTHCGFLLVVIDDLHMHKWLSLTEPFAVLTVWLLILYSQALVTFMVCAWRACFVLVCISEGSEVA